MPRTPTTHRRSTTAAVGAATAVLVLLPAAAASAHVRVFPDTTDAGSYPVLTFRVPNESDVATTTEVQVTLPTDHPFTYAAVQPVPGWTAEVTEAELPAPVDVEGTTITRAPRTITWTADAGAGIAPGQFQRFPVLAGALPEAGTTVVLPAVQTYSDGTVVSWDQPVPASGEEPEDPAPTLVTTAAAAAGADASSAPPAAATAAGSTTAVTAATGSAPGSTATGPSSGAGLWLGLTGAVLGAAGLVVSLLRRRPGTAS